MAIRANFSFTGRDGRVVNAGFTLPIRCTPSEMQSGVESAAGHMLFLKADVTKSPPFSFFVKKNAGLTERPDPALFKPCEVRGTWFEALLEELSLVQGEPIGQQEDAIDSLGRIEVRQIRSLVALLEGSYEGSSILKIGGRQCSLSSTSYSLNGGARGDRYEWHFEETSGLLHALAKGTEAWTAVDDGDFVACLAQLAATLTPAERAEHSAPTTQARRLTAPPRDKLQRLVAGTQQGQATLAYFDETLRLSEVGIRDNALGSVWVWHLDVVSEVLRTRKRVPDEDNAARATT